MAESVLERSRSGWDIVLGGLLVIGGFIILGHAAFATVVSVLFLGWMLLLFGVVGLVGALFRIGKGGFWSSALTGGLLTVLGVVFLRNVGAAVVTLTLVAGAMFLTGGITRLVAAGGQPEYRLALVLSGLVSAALGLLVLFNLFAASFTLLGVLLGVETLMDGIAMMLVGRVRVVPEATAQRPGVPTP
jgi:membrane protein HdeD